MCHLLLVCVSFLLSSMNQSPDFWTIARATVDLPIKNCSLVVNHTVSCSHEIHRFDIYMTTANASIIQSKGCMLDSVSWEDAITTACPDGNQSTDGCVPQKPYSLWSWYGRILESILLSGMAVNTAIYISILIFSLDTKNPLPMVWVQRFGLFTQTFLWFTSGFTCIAWLMMTFPLEWNASLPHSMPIHSSTQDVFFVRDTCLLPLEQSVRIVPISVQDVEFDWVAYHMYTIIFLILTLAWLLVIPLPKCQRGRHSYAQIIPMTNDITVDIT